ncbi:hypothetical protein JOL79_10960 [Microbispora sp. RL4-1S]|uniref:KAP NTPase domain-containing protein n=1 Tax=Microbispora oryzae TaxID=2806554 RepID=A0A940WJC8_9ACTN|nr:hypothetical protein [Microbispora oryzae]MBP2704332.1 hypothetical protein [Microbispora oryzae]
MGATSWPPGNPILADPVLFGQYMAALDAAMADPEFRDAFDNVWVTPFRVRVMMLRNAADILRSASREFAEYEKAFAWQVVSADAWLEDLRVALEEHRLETPLNAIGVGSGVLGLLVTGVGLIGGIWWDLLGSLTWIGVTTLVFAVVARILFRIRTHETTIRVIVGVAKRIASLVTYTSVMTTSLGPRDVLMAAVREREITAQIRVLINAFRDDSFDLRFAVSASPGLSEAFDSTYHVPTMVAAELDELLDRLSGAGIGVAGPRGSGKSTLVRRFCEDSTALSEHADLRCMVSAPVEYAPRDFVLHLFAVFCRTAIRQFTREMRHHSRFAGMPAHLVFRIVRRAVMYGAAGWALLRWGDLLPVVPSIASTVGIGVLGLGGLLTLVSVIRSAWIWRKETHACPQARLVRQARRHLDRIRYLQTHTTGWSGALKLPVGMEGQRSHGMSKAEQSRSYPDIVTGFRSYTQRVAALLAQRGSRVFIGIDELDKIGSGEHAERFLNEIKGIFGLPHVYFMISVSDDAMNAFERRGLPFRDAFDSSFDEIIYVGPLGYEESRRLLRRRVVGLTDPYIALCHTLSGGLPRDIIRAARRVVRAGNALPPEEATLSSICRSIVGEEIRHKARAITRAVTLPSAPETTPPEMLDLLHELSQGAGIPVGEILDAAVTCPTTSPAFDFAAYAYFCATLEEVFTDELTVTLIRRACAEQGSGSFDALAATRQTFGLDTRLAWRATTAFRRCWSLKVYSMRGET